MMTYDSTMTSSDELSKDRDLLLFWIGLIHDGRIDNLIIVDGEPQLDPLPRMVFARDIKRALEEQGPRANWGLLRQHARMQELLDLLDFERNSVIETLEIRHGLPVRATYYADH